MQTLLQMTRESAVLIGVIALLRRLLLNRMPKRSFLILWDIALFRLLVPFSIPSPTSIYTLFTRVQNTLPAQTVLPAASPSMPAAALPAAATPVSTFSPLLCWAAGAAVCAVWLIGSHLRFLRRAADSLPLDTPFIRRWTRQHPLRRTVRIRTSDRIGTPMTYGLLRPTILLPKALARQEESLSLILLHEYIHIRRLDILRKGLLCAALCLHWFNPLVWLMFYLAGRDTELACDEAVLRSCGGDRRTDYAYLLLRLEENRLPHSPTASYFSKNHIRERITAIMKMKKATMLSLLATAVLVAGTATVFATSTSAGSSDEKSSVTAQAEISSEPEEVPASSAPEEKSADTASSEPEETPASSAPEENSADTTSSEPEEVPASSVPEENSVDTTSSEPEETPASSALEESSAAGSEITIHTLLWPIDGGADNISASFGNHSGIDIRADAGTNIRAAADGKVQSTGFDSRWGNFVLIDHGGYQTLYAHCRTVSVSEGDTVSAGSSIASVGSSGSATGPCLHFELRVADTAFDPIDYLTP